MNAKLNKNPKILVNGKIPDQALEFLSKTCEVEQWTDEIKLVAEKKLADKIADVEGLYCLLTDKVDRELLAGAPKLRVVSNMAVGYDNIDVAACTEKGIIVTNTPGILTETTADLTMALLLATARRIVEASDYLRKGKWKTWSPMLLTGQDVYGATMGIIGMGRIGEAVAKRAKGFEMKVLYYNRRQNPETEARLAVSYRELDELLAESDFVVILTPMTPETVNLISQRELELMKPTAILINCARGAIVNQQDLYNTLFEQKIWAAGLDVFAKEPIEPNNPLLTLPNVVLLPHIGSASIATRTKMAMMAAQNLVEALQGKEPNEPKNMVNPEVLEQ